MDKIDLKKEIPSYRARRGRFDVVEVPRLRYLMIDGHGDPNTSAGYGDAVSALFGLAYGLKFLSKRELDRDYVVMPLEGLWWADDLTAFTSARDKSLWSWTLLNLVPDWIADEHLERVRTTGGDASAFSSVRLDTLAEGRCVQTLHVGSYDDEAPVLDELHTRAIPDSGLRMRGLHHEVYLSDRRRTAPEKLRTILRQPVADA
ncbi:GyrI-like domain-containing protein [Microbacterium sp. AZCO]|uniref:GyrI-like domain-containing protein n=1 Tax=Microbacterium sp. AZCO TaxID=3142976 RepID=UPI0031F405A6